ncbi:hypothetical protein DNL40_02595 [Xylanimonas oleitrophica]|uniref:Uncharacterized protein n=1 Tax=Xylanimonas oleitrophica TaxID=2607479 RepID=A0A2W5XX51_9MICO|nr:hypothetical protein [Xylanimonas oleitrophica]PZR55278.1 hypothetical protein DNL40_02595 [Xylanimonas oleitrophica]
MTALDVDLTLTVGCAADGCTRPAVVAGRTICPGRHPSQPVCGIHQAQLIAGWIDVALSPEGVVVCDEHEYQLPMPPVEWRVI